MRGQVFAAIAVFGAMLALPGQAAAQSYGSYHDEHVANQEQCQRARNNNTVGGAVIGGIAGAVLGSHSSARRHRGDGTALGAVVGAAAGGAIGRSSTRCDEAAQGSYDPYNHQSYNRYPDDYRDDSGLEGGAYRGSGYGDDYGRDCRMGQIITRDPYGREYRENVMMCRGRDGVWRPQD